MRYAFVAEHRQQFSVRTMSRCLRIHPSGFYAWLKNPLSKRAQEHIRQTRLIKDARSQSGKVYGYRKLHDDLLDQGETLCQPHCPPARPAKSFYRRFTWRFDVASRKGEGRRTLLLDILTKDALDDRGAPFLVTPFGNRDGLPSHMRKFGWRDLATANTDDRLLCSKRVEIEADIACHGYCYFFPD